MTSTQYAELLKDPRWQKKRLRILERDGWECQGCHDRESTLVVHHRYYLPDTLPWAYPNRALVTLCQSCHDIETADMPASENAFMISLKGQFLCADIDRMARGFANLKILYASEVTASVIEWILSTDSVFRTLTEQFFATEVRSQRVQMNAEGRPPKT